MKNHPGQPYAGLLAVARNDHVTPPSVYWQVPPAHDAKRRGRCWAWLLWGEGGCTVRRCIMRIRNSPCRFPAAGLLLGHRISPSWTPTPLHFICPGADGLRGKVGRGQLTITLSEMWGKKWPRVS